MNTEAEVVRVLALVRVDLAQLNQKADLALASMKVQSMLADNMAMTLKGIIEKDF